MARDAGMTPEDAQLVLSHMRVPDAEYNDCYALGCFEKRVTVRSQQIRALNLVCALHSAGKLKSPGKVLVIGGGAGGMTEAAAAARLGYEVTLLERKSVLLPIFRGNNTRWLHPSIYDWPDLPGPERHDGGPQHEDEAGLPLLSWRAALAQDVADQLDKQWAALPERSRIQVVLNVQYIHLGSGRPRYVTWDAGPESGDGRFDAVILAVGFGFERAFPEVRWLSYWDNDSLHQPTRGGVESYLISGCGDGGLIDLLRLKLEDFRHEAVRKLVSVPGLASVKEELLEIEKEARTLDSPELFLQERYRKLKVPAEVDNALRLRTDTTVTLNGEADSPLTMRASILSRFLASRLLYGLRVVPYRPGKFTLAHKGTGYEVQFKLSKPEFFQHVLIRHGPGPSAMEEGFAPILEKCAPMRARNELDQTRVPRWKPGFFSPRPGGGTPPSPPETPGSGTPPPGGKIIGSSVESLKSGFKGREGTLKQLHDLLGETGKVALTGGTAGLVYAHGSGGMGKSRLAIEYAHRYRHEYPGGVFFSYVADKTPLAVFAEFARGLFGDRAPSREPEAALMFAQWLQDAAQGPRLLVFDDVQAQTREDLARRFSDSTQEQGQPLWPIHRAHVHLLFTTRMRDLESEVEGAKGLSVERLDADPALELLLDRAKTRQFLPEDLTEARRLASEDLGGHPLALSLAGAYLGRRKQTTVARYRQELRDKGPTYNLEQATKWVGHTVRDHERSIVATYDLSRAHLDLSNEDDALALRLLELSAFLSPGTRIDPELLMRLLRASGNAAEWLQIERALARLTADLSLLDDAGRDVMIHPLIADYTRWRIHQAGKQEGLHHTLLQGMNGLFPDSADEFWRITRPGAHPDWEHLSAAREAHVTSVWGHTRVVESEERTILSRSLGDLYILRGKLNRAREAFEQALEIGQRLTAREPKHTNWQRDVSVSLNKLGDVLLKQGNLEGARRTFEQDLEIAQRLAARKPKHTVWQRDVSVSLERLGDVLLEQENLEGARRAFEQSLEIRQRLVAREPKHTVWQRDVSLGLNKLGDVLLEQDNLEGARRAFEQSLEIRQRLAAREPEHIGWQRDVSVGLNRLGDVLLEQENLEGARRAFEQSLEIRQRLAAREPEHIGWQTDLVVSQFKIAVLLASGSTPERTQAVPLLTQALGTLRRLAADARLTHVQQHEWLPTIESALRQLKNEDPS